MIDTSNMNIIQKMKLNMQMLESNALNIILSSNTEKSMHIKTDSYIQQKQDVCMYATYTSSGTLQNENAGISKEEIWEYLANFQAQGGGVLTGGFTVNGQFCQFDQVEKMDEDVLQELKAVDNVLTLESGIYYGITTHDGGEENTWGMNVADSNGFTSCLSEGIYAMQHDITLEELGKWNCFFDMVTERTKDAAASGIYISLSKKEVRDMMDKLGFEPGWCTILVNGEENTFFYSNNGKVYPKYEYDGNYLGITQGDNSRVYEIGAEFNYNGTIYTMDEEGHINVPYGEDIFNCISRPESKYAKEMKN